MARPDPFLVRVVTKHQLSPHVLRLTLGGDGLSAFGDGVEGGYIKLRLFPNGGDKPTVRTYTIRAQRKGEIDVDFTLHADADGKYGPATHWAMTAKIGDTIEIGGPGDAKPLPDGHEFYLIAGDMTSMPAILVNLEKLPAHAVGYAVIEVQSKEDRPDVDVPAGVDLDFVINPISGSNPELLARKIRAAAPDTGDIYAWAACEFESMKALRQFLRAERGLGPDQLYISSYWKAGVIEDEHKVIKRQDAEEQA